MINPATMNVESQPPGKVTMDGTAVRSNQANVGLHLRALWRYRELVLSLALRELRARYKNTVLGFFWSLLNPLAMMLVFTMVFTVFIRNSELENFPIFILCGLLAWNYFTAGVMGSINAIVGNANLVTKVYFPREALPIATVLANLFNFLLTLILLFVALFLFRPHFSPWLWLLPFVVLIQTFFILGLAFILSTLNVFYRDTLMVMDVAILAWFFLTPIFYPISQLPQNYVLFGQSFDLHRLMYILNPMASIVSTYRDLLYWGYRSDFDFFARTALTSLVVLAFGYWFFCKYSSRFGEEV